MADTDIKITEILYDAPNSLPNDNDYEWVEISNTGPDDVSLNGWTLDDSISGGTTGIVPDLTLHADDVAILYNADISEADFLAAYGPVPPGTVLVPVTHWQPLNNGSGGDTVNLTSDDDVTISSIAYPDDAAPGESLRYDVNGNYIGAGTPNPGVVCFTRGTRIRTERGETPIEDLAVGDLVMTRDHGLQAIRWIGQREVGPAEMAANPDFCPVLIRKSAMGPGVPARDTRVSQAHRILLEDTLATLLFGQPKMLAAAKGLCNDRSIRVDSSATRVTYFHILFDRHEVITADGLASESFHPVAAGLDSLERAARRELLGLFPELASGDMPAAYPLLSLAEVALLAG